MRKWTREEFIELLHTNDKAVGRALLSLLQEQTAEEQINSETIFQNGRGFSSSDARVMTSMASFYASKGFLSPRQIKWLRGGRSQRFPSRIGKYAGQLAKKVNRRVKQLQTEVEELSSRNQTPAVLSQLELKIATLAKISPKENDTETNSAA